ncbi:MAG: prephenate dehydrogenase/arogenate dehydrogenase family protein [Oscillospiraceae bacterium]|nr:prephenate dehydrogenase/arogenate dehydrogenase family protein [Oscillospiraceae bacterium]
MREVKILVVGMGLIGGSVCKGLKKYTDYKVGGYDSNGSIVKSAFETGVIDIPVKNKKEFHDYNVVIIAINPLHMSDFLESCVENFSQNAIIADVCGVKGELPARLTALCAEHGLRYVSTHPMAGRERPGFENSFADLFLNANFIVTPIAGSDLNAIETIEGIAREIGFNNFSRVSPEEHDSIIAYTSQLAHVISSAYVKSPTIARDKGFTGGSFQDMSRIATMNEDMWTALFLLNREKLVEETDILIENLLKYKIAIAQGDEEELKRLIRESRLLKEKNLSDNRFLTRFDG